MRTRLFVHILLIITAVLGATVLDASTVLPVYAAEITVNTTDDEFFPDGDCSLRDAIQAANLDAPVDGCTAGSGADIIRLAVGTYLISLPGLGEDENMIGDLDIIGDLSLIGANQSTTIIDTNSNDRVLDVHSGTVTVANVTIQGGIGYGEASGIRNYGLLTLNDVTVRGNQEGIGLSNTGTLVLNRSTVSWNVTVSVASGIDNAGTAILNDSFVSFNSSTGETPGTGLGIVNTGSLILNHTTVDANQGGLLNSGTANLTDSTVSNNESRGVGAGGINNRGKLTLVNTTISQNATSSCCGGGISNSGSATLINSTVSGNIATSDPELGASHGGGIFNSGDLTLLNATITNNSTRNFFPQQAIMGDGGGIFNSGTVNLGNTIIAGNTDAGGETPDCAGTLNSRGYNLIQTITGCTIVGDTTGNLLGVNPRLGPLQNNGGPTQTHALLPDSPAIDRANPAPPASEWTCRATDQRGVARPQDGNGDGLARCDMGAFERERPNITRIRIDIKPGSSTNPINLKSNGVVPVALLSTSTFDATTVDPLSVRFEPAGATEAHKQGHKQDVNGDSRLDLVLHFHTQETGIRSGDTQACLSGKTKSGLLFEGCDAIQPKK